MAIINITKDSFYAGSRAMDDAAIAKALQLADEGADIIDIGGESTRPGSEPINIEEEIKRVVPVIEAIVDKLDKKTKISVDTYKIEVARAAVEAGATIVNDITGMQSQEMRELVSDEHLECVIMHMQGTPKTMQLSPAYQNVVKEIRDFLAERIDACETVGVHPQHIIVDPGIGFGKTTQHNLEILRNLEKFKELGKRLLIGASRKSFIGKILQNEEYPLAPEDRLEGSLAIASYCSLKGIDILRVHDVKETVRTIKILERLK